MNNEAPPTAESDVTFRFRWTTTFDVIATVVVAADELDTEDLLSIEEYAYDLAVERVKERLEQVAVTINDVAVHGDIDGVEAADIEQVFPPGSTGGAE